MSATRKWAVVGTIVAVSGIGIGTAAQAAASDDVKLNDQSTTQPASSVGAASTAGPSAVASADTPGETASTNTPGDTSSANSPANTASANTPGDDTADSPS